MVSVALTSSLSVTTAATVSRLYTLMKSTTRCVLAAGAATMLTSVVPLAFMPRLPGVYAVVVMSRHDVKHCG